MSFEKPQLTLFIALPCAGKTTLAKRLAQDTGAIRLCTDEELAARGINFFDEAARAQLEAESWEQAKQLLVDGRNVILEDGHWLRSDRDKRLTDLATLAVRTELHYLPVPFEELVRRSALRNENGAASDVPLTRAQLEQYQAMFEAPDAAELARFDTVVIHQPE